MKTSTKYLLATALVLLASLTAYNMALRAEYRKGDYKNPLHAYVAQPFQNFTEVSIPAAHAVSVKLVRGPFSVRLHPGAVPYVHLRQQGQKLTITASFPNGRHYFGPAQTVIISCPRLAALSTDAVYEENGQQARDKNYHDSQLVLVQGFAQDSLTLRQDRGSRIELAGNTLGYLRAAAGFSGGSHGLLQINADNRIAAASLKLDHQNELTLNNVLIPKLRHQLGDSVKITLSGAALRSLAN